MKPFFGSISDSLKTYLLTEACEAGDLLQLIQARKATREPGVSTLFPDAEARSLMWCAMGLRTGRQTPQVHWGTWHSTPRTR